MILALPFRRSAPASRPLGYAEVPAAYASDAQQLTHPSVQLAMA